MIKSSLRQLCLMSIFCGAALSISPEGSVKKLMNVLVTAVLITAVLGPLRGFDFSEYALQKSKLNQQEHQLMESGADLSRRLNRLVIEDEYEAYIMDKAAELEIEISSLKIGVIWSTEGLWVPESVEITSTADTEKKSRLGRIITADLGIAPERQYWKEYE